MATANSVDLCVCGLPGVRRKVPPGGGIVIGLVVSMLLWGTLVLIFV